MFEKISEFLCQYVEVKKEEIKKNSRFREDLGFNSYDFFCMLGDAEDEFEIEIDEQKATQIKTVDDMINYIKEIGIC